MKDLVDVGEIPGILIFPLNSEWLHSSLHPDVEAVFFSMVPT